MKNRTIKFRMWNNVPENPSKSKMFYDTENVMECLKQQMWHNEGKPFGYDHTERGCVFMQSSGVRDCNNKYFYENDIVKGGVRTMKVIFKQEACQFWLVWKCEDEISRYEPLNPTYADDTNVFSNDRLEIIGNVFDNPELIK